MTEGAFSNYVGVFRVPLHDLRGPHPPPTIEGAFSDCMGVFRPLAKPRTVPVLVDLGPYSTYIVLLTKKSTPPPSVIPFPPLEA